MDGQASAVRNPGGPTSGFLSLLLPGASDGWSSVLLVYCLDPSILLGVFLVHLQSPIAGEGWGQETGVPRLVPSSHFYQPVSFNKSGGEGKLAGSLLPGPLHEGPTSGLVTSLQWLLSKPCACPDLHSAQAWYASHFFLWPLLAHRAYHVGTPEAN